MQMGSMCTILRLSQRRSLNCSGFWIRKRLPLKLGRGCDFHMSYENIQEAKAEPGGTASTGWAICWSSFRIMVCRKDLTEIFYQLQLAGLTPILTHPERNRYAAG